MDLYKDLSTDCLIINLARNLDGSKNKPLHHGEVDHSFLMDSDGYLLTDSEDNQLYSND